VGLSDQRNTIWDTAELEGDIKHGASRLVHGRASGTVYTHPENPFSPCSVNSLPLTVSLILTRRGPPHSEGLFDLTEGATPSPLGQMRKVPLLRWDQIDQMVMPEEPSRVIQAEAMLETDVSGIRTFAMQVRDNSMQPLFSEGEVIFVNPDLQSEPSQYVMVDSEDGRPEGALLRQLKEISGQATLHPLNQLYKDLPVTNQHRILGRVVRMRKNL